MSSGCLFGRPGEYVRERRKPDLVAYEIAIPRSFPGPSGQFVSTKGDFKWCRAMSGREGSGSEIGLGKAQLR